MEIEGLNMELGTLLEMLQRVQSQVESGDMAYEQMTATLAKLRDMLAQTNNEAAKDAISQSISDIESQLNSLNTATETATQTQNNLRGSVNSTAGAFKAGNKALGAMGKTVAGVSSGMQTLGIANETLGKSFGLLSTVMGIATSASAALKMALTAISSHPIMIAVTALIGGLLYLADAFDVFSSKEEKNQEVSDSVSNAWDRMGASAEGAAGKIKSASDEIEASWEKLKYTGETIEKEGESIKTTTEEWGKYESVVQSSIWNTAKEYKAASGEKKEALDDELGVLDKLLHIDSELISFNTKLADSQRDLASKIAEYDVQITEAELRKSQLTGKAAEAEEANINALKKAKAQATKDIIEANKKQIENEIITIQKMQKALQGFKSILPEAFFTVLNNKITQTISEMKQGIADYNKQETELNKQLNNTTKTTTSSTTTHNNHSKTIKKEADVVSDLTKQLKTLDDQLKIDVVSAESELDAHKKVIEGLNAEMDAAEKALENTKLTEEQKLAIQSKIADIGKKMTEENAKWENKQYSDQLDKYKQFQQDKLDVLEQAAQQSRTTAYDEYNKEAEAIQQLYDEGLISFEDYSDKREDAENKLNDKLKSIETHHSNEMVQVRQAIADQALAQFGENSDEYKQALNDLNQAIEDNAQKMADNLSNTTVNAGKAMQTAADKFESIANHIQKVSGAIASLGQTIVKSIQDRIQKQLEAGEISQEQAEEEFEKTKATEIAITTITTLAGVAGAIASAWKDSTITSVVAKAIIGATNAAAMLATGIAQINQIKSTTIGSGGLDGGSGAVPIVTGAATPILNEAADVQGLQNVNVVQPDSAAQQDQRVYILQSDITESNKQVNIRQTNSTF